MEKRISEKSVFNNIVNKMFSSHSSFYPYASKQFLKKINPCITWWEIETKISLRSHRGSEYSVEQNSGSSLPSQITILTPIQLSFSTYLIVWKEEKVIPLMLLLPNSF